VKSSGNSDLHQVLAVVHGAAMIATPILGVLAQDNDDLAETHFLSAATLVTSYVAAMAVMTF
jgi:hypothetical protein